MGEAQKSKSKRDYCSWQPMLCLPQEPHSHRPSHKQGSRNPTQSPVARPYPTHQRSQDIRAQWSLSFPGTTQPLQLNLSSFTFYWNDTGVHHSIKGRAEALSLKNAGTRKTQMSRTSTRDSSTIRTLFSFLLSFALHVFFILSYWRNLRAWTLETAAWDSNPNCALSFISWTTLSKWLIISVPQFSHKYNNSAYLLGFLEEGITEYF